MPFDAATIRVVIEEIENVVDELRGMDQPRNGREDYSARFTARVLQDLANNLRVRCGMEPED